MSRKKENKHYKMPELAKKLRNKNAMKKLTERKK